MNEMTVEISYYQYLMLYYIEDIFIDTTYTIRENQIRLDDIGSWDSRKQKLIRRNEDEPVPSTLQSFIETWFLTDPNPATNQELDNVARQVFPFSSPVDRYGIFLTSKYNISLENIASIYPKRGSFRLTVKEGFFKVFRHSGNTPGQLTKFEITYKCQTILEIIRYLIRVFYDYHTRRTKHTLADLHQTRYEKSLRLINNIGERLHSATQTNLKNFVEMVENFQNTNATYVHNQDQEVFHDYDDIIATMTYENYENYEAHEEIEEIAAEGPLKRGRTSSSQSVQSEFIISDPRHYGSPSSSSSSSSSTFPSSSSSSLASFSHSTDLLIHINNTLTLIQQHHPHRLDELSRLERNQLFNHLYPQLFQLLQSQDPHFFQIHCFPILKMILAYQFHSKNDKFYIHYFMSPDLVDKIDQILNSILPNMAPDDEEDTYLCQVRDPSFFKWLHHQHPHWVHEGHQIILHTFQKYYQKNWNELCNPFDVTNPCVDYVVYVAKNLLYHLFQDHQYELIQSSLIFSVKWLTSVLCWIGSENLIQQLLFYIDEILIDIPLPDISLQFLNEECGCPSSCFVRISSSHVTTLALLISFFHLIKSFQFNSQEMICQYFIIFLQIRYLNQPLYTLSPTLSSLFSQCQQILLQWRHEHHLPSGFFPIFINRNILNYKLRVHKKLLCYHQSSCSKNTVLLHHNPTGGSNHPQGYGITFISYNSTSQSVNFYDGPPSDRNINAISDIYLDDTTSSLWISCEISKQGGWVKYWCLQQYSYFLENHCFPFQFETLNERFKIDKILHVSSRSMLIYEELKGILVLSSTNGREYQFVSVIEMRSNGICQSLYTLSPLQRSSLMTRPSLTSYELRNNEIFLLLPNYSTEIQFWSILEKRILFSLDSERFLLEEIGFISEVISSNETTVTYFLIIYQTYNSEIIHEGIYQLTHTPLSLQRLTMIPTTVLPSQSQSNQLQLDTKQSLTTRQNLFREIESSQWFPFSMSAYEEHHHQEQHQEEREKKESKIQRRFISLYSSEMESIILYLEEGGTLYVFRQEKYQ